MAHGRLRGAHHRAGDSRAARIAAKRPLIEHNHQRDAAINVPATIGTALRSSV